MLQHEQDGAHVEHLEPGKLNADDDATDRCCRR